MDAQWRSVSALAWLAPGVGLDQTPLGSLLRVGDSLYSRDWLTDAPNTAGLVVCVEARLDHLRRAPLSGKSRPAFRPSIFARLDRFSRAARTARREGRLL